MTPTRHPAGTAFERAHLRLVDQVTQGSQAEARRNAALEDQARIESSTLSDLYASAAAQQTRLQFGVLGDHHLAGVINDVATTCLRMTLDDGSAAWVAVEAVGSCAGLSVARREAPVEASERSMIEDIRAHVPPAARLTLRLVDGRIVAGHLAGLGRDWISISEGTHASPVFVPRPSIAAAIWKQP